MDKFHQPDVTPGPDAADAKIAPAGQAGVTKFTNEALHAAWGKRERAHDSGSEAMQLPPGDRDAMRGAKDGHLLNDMDKLFKNDNPKLNGEKMFDKPSESTPVTPEQQKQAKEALDAKVSPLIPEADANALKQLGAAVLDGNVKGVAEALAPYKDQPEKMQKMVEELNKNLEATNAGVHAMMRDGKVVLYKDGGSAAVEIDPSTGKASTHPMREHDGNVILEPGEIINKTPDQVLKDIGDSATRGISGGKDMIEFSDILKQVPGRPENPFDPGRPRPNTPEAGSGGISFEPDDLLKFGRQKR